MTGARSSDVMNAMAEESSRADWARWAAPWLVIFAVSIAYSNSFHGEMIYDDLSSIQRNPEIRNLIPREYNKVGTTLDGRPVLRFSLAVDYAIGGLDVRIYHATNFATHIACCLLVYGIVRRTLLQQRVWGNRFIHSAPWLAAAVAGLWGVHPLNTESVTYIVQRAESLASMFYLLVIYCVIRAADSSKSLGFWGITAITATVLGVGCKEMVATVPVASLLYSWIFLKPRLGRLWVIHLGMLSCWVVLASQMLNSVRGSSAGFYQGISATQYALTQLRVIALYLHLMVWPSPLVLDREDWPVTKSVRDVGFAGAWVALLVVLTIFALWRWPKVGFAGAWFFLILAPTSSFMPIPSEIVAEHRMYLPMLGWIALAVVGGWMLAGSSEFARQTEVGMVIALGVILCTLTIRRNAQYRTAVGIWTDTVAHEPGDMRAHLNLGESLTKEALHYPAESARFKSLAAQALEQYSQAMQLAEEALVQHGSLAEAEGYYDDMLQHDPRFIGRINLLRGKVRIMRGNYLGARDDFLTAIAVHPNDAVAHYQLGLVDEKLNDWTDAAAELQTAVQLDPQNADARSQLATVKSMAGNK
ncbi:MAG: tetratricopeptide repeat protein [Tepidisphaeraceae bacterium]